MKNMFLLFVFLRCKEQKIQLQSLYHGINNVYFCILRVYFKTILFFFILNFFLIFSYYFNILILKINFNK